MRTRPFTKSAGNRPDILRNGSVRQLARYEAGVKRPSVENLTKLADVLETSTDAILGRNTA